MSSVTTDLNQNTGLEIAIIGLVGRFPGASNIDEFWQNLRDGVESTITFTDAELLATGVPADLLQQPSYVKAGAPLAEIDQFDANFFGINPREAEITDPQQRLFMEAAWEALEHAGYEIEQYAGLIGVYAGTSLNGYLLNLYQQQNLTDIVDVSQLTLGNDKDYLTTRISYKLNLEGPSYAIQTACSTSLVAVHLACQGLLSGECDMALAGGISINLQQEQGYYYQEGGVLSPDGHCRAFDAKAQGCFRGNGLGIVVLKRLEDALLDGDYIHAVIKGSATNNDGALKVSFTAPRIESQAKVIHSAQSIAEVDPETITYVETHGTGTPLGDPIEIAALTQAFRDRTDKTGFCAVGSLKTNIGHLDAAAGVAGLIKTTLALKHRQIPPSLNFEQPNPQIDFDNSPFYVNTTLVDWPQAPGQTPNTPLRAGVSAFGIGGTNAHLILESAPPVEPSSPSRPWHLLLLSAKTPTALATATTHMTQYCQQHPELNLADVAYTLQVGRKAFEHRRMLVCQNLQEALTALEVPAPQSMLTQTVPAQRQSVVFLFPGQGSQYPDMGQALYQTEPLFREQVDHCCELIKPLLGIDLRPILYPNLNPSSNHASTLPRLDQTAYAQPALFITAYALAQLWQSWGIQPRAMLGHSIGEYVAACLAGVFSLEDALRLVVARGQLMQQCDPGSMLSVPRAAADLADLLTPTLAVAASNGPQLSVISGPTDAIAELQKRLSQASIESRLLHTSHAFHSAMMEPILEPFQQQVAQIQLNAPQIPFISNLTGTWIKPEEATNAHYWVQHLRQTVQLGSGIEVLSQNTEQIWLEVGPGKVLSTLVRRQYPTAQVLNSMRHPQASEADLKVLLTTLGRLWLAGVHVDWAKYYQYERRYRLPLPTYPFERQRYWIEPLSQEAIVSNLSLAANTPAPAANLLTPQRHPAEWLYRPYWQQAAPLLPLVPEAHATDHQCWLIFMDAWGIGSQMVAALKQLDQTVITVQPEADFQQLSPLTYGVNPQVREHYDLLLTELTASQQMPHHVVHLWGLTPLISSTTPSDALQQTQPFSFESVLFFSQALGTHTITDPLQLAIITHNLWDVTGEESLCPEQALVLGPCRVLPLEYPYLRCHHIDIVLPDGGRHATDQNPAVAVSTDRCQQLATQLLTELTTATTTSHFEIAVAYRGRHRWVQRFEPVAAEPSKIAPPRLRPEGVYLITGGLGGLGLAMAKQLAQSVQARLILVSRSGLPERTAWPQWLASHEATDRVSRQIHQVQTLIDLGAEVLVIAADVADGEQMRSTIAQATDKFGAVNGLIHAAGVAGEGLAQLKTRDTVKQVLAPKVNGTLVLDAILDQAELDFRVLFSSLNSVLGALGQIDYCAANAFLDSFAYASNIRGGPPTIAINWDTWQEVGMAVDTTLPAELQAEHEKALAAGIPTQTGAAILEQLLRSPLPQVLVSTQDFQAELAQRHTSWAAIETLDQFAVDLPLAEVPSSTYPRPHLSVDYVAPRNPLEQTIADIWQRFLGIESVGVYDDFLELGGHSLLAVQVISRLRTQFQVELPLQNLFEEPTIDRIATLIQAAQAGADTAPDNADGTVTSPTIAPVSRAAYRMKLSTLDQPATNQTSQLSQSNENGDKL